MFQLQNTLHNIRRVVTSVCRIINILDAILDAFLDARLATGGHSFIALSRISRVYLEASFFGPEASAASNVEGGCKCACFSQPSWRAHGIFSSFQCPGNESSETNVSR
eukprot:scaffold369239_cov16-Prasinocladus_malaysianus.AAC.1